MRGLLITALTACLAVFVFSAPKPASALPAQAAVNYSHTNADLVEVKKKYKYNKKYRYGRYYRGPRYGYRPYRYYRGPRYGYYGYRPYYGYGYGYRPYWRRGGVSIWW
ncbi:hypothetical protein AUC69_06865 [Methyloceanibacter superfactus]|jgi:hypothetical protein|uniref:Sulfur globule protein n=1 Tax=Methyloceanibacter superfactus TaxID=1774969 RepID=A0A1E3W6J2_9HYPH|nr:hypothetical protein [Methyloceanibacter superfactus]ODS01455.1 hypothetical protein AUC69_06865 [Methyloceanibacter superfactus]